MKIEREYFKPIRKKEIPLNDLEDYNNIDINYLNKSINEVITNYTYNTFDLLDLIMSKYDGNLESTIAKIDNYSNVKFNCYYACKLLKKKLKDSNIKSYLISYKSIGFSNEIGDDIIKEAHTSLIIPTLRNKKVYYILLDPGLRIPEVIGFYSDDEETNLQIDNDKIKIKKCHNNLYNYTMIMEGYNRYSVGNSYYCQEYFDLSHELLNPEELLFPIALNILSGYRIINFNTLPNNTSCIKIMILDEYIECLSNKKYIKLYFDELVLLSDKELCHLLEPFTNILDINKFNLIKTIRFVIKIKEELKSNVLNYIEPNSRTNKKIKKRQK